MYIRIHVCMDLHLFILPRAPADAREALYYHLSFSAVHAPKNSSYNNYTHRSWYKTQNCKAGLGTNALIHGAHLHRAPADAREALYYHLSFSAARLLRYPEL